MKHPARIISILVLVAALVLSTGCTATKTQSISIQEQTQLQPVEQGNYTMSVSSPLDPKTYYNAQDIVDVADFTPIAINISEQVTERDDVLITRSAEGNLNITNTTTGLYNYVLSGTMTGTVTLTSDNANAMVTFDRATISGTSLPALQLKSSTKTFINLEQGTKNFLADSEDNQKKGVLTSSGDVIFLGEGSLQVVSNKKHALKIDGVLRMQSGILELITTEKAQGNGIIVDKAFIMDAGSLTIEAKGSVYGEESKGIKVNGLEGDYPVNGCLVVNGGTISIVSVGKAMTAGWDIDEDAETESTSDDPTPNLIINNGVITIETTAKPYEISEEESLSPEGLEAKQSLVINGGLIQISTTDDALNAGTSIEINGGMIFAYSTEADAVDSNGTLEINGGTLVALGSRAPETALDCDNNQNFTYTGGTIVAIGGGANNTPLATTTEGSVLTYGGTLASGSSFALSNATNDILIAYTIPSYYGQGSALLLASDALKQGDKVTLTTGGNVTSKDSFNGLALGETTYTDGTSEAITLSSSVTHLGEELRSMGFSPNPPQGFEGARPQMPEGFKPPEFQK